MVARWCWPLSSRALSRTRISEELPLCLSGFHSLAHVTLPSFSPSLTAWQELQTIETFQALEVGNSPENTADVPRGELHCK